MRRTYHHALIRTRMSEAVNAGSRARFDVGDAPRGGDSYTVNATGGGDNQTSGGSFKIVADTEDWDNSVGLNNPGQSGDPDEPALPRSVSNCGRAGKYFPIFFSRSKVESVAEQIVRLEPAARGGGR